MMNTRFKIKSMLSASLGLLTLLVSIAAQAKSVPLRLHLNSPAVMTEVQRLIQRMQFSASPSSFAVATQTTARAALESLDADRALIEKEASHLPENEARLAVLAYFEGVRLVRTLGELSGYARIGRSEGDLLQMGLRVPVSVASALQRMDDQNPETPSFQFHPLSASIVRVQANPATTLSVSLQAFLTSPSESRFLNHVKLDFFKLALMERAAIELNLENTPYEKRESEADLTQTIKDAPTQTPVLQSWARQLVREKHLRANLTSKIFEAMEKQMSAHADRFAAEVQQAIAQMILDGKINRWIEVPEGQAIPVDSVLRIARKQRLFYQMALGVPTDSIRKELIQEKWLQAHEKIDNKHDERVKALTASLMYYPGLWTNMSQETLKGFIADTAAKIEAEFLTGYFIGDLHPLGVHCNGPIQPKSCPTFEERKSIRDEFKKILTPHFQQEEFKNSVVKPVYRVLPVADRQIPVVSRFDTAKNLVQSVQTLNAHREILKKVASSKQVLKGQLPTQINWVFAMVAIAGSLPVPDWFLMMIDPSGRKHAEPQLLAYPSLLLGGFGKWRSFITSNETRKTLLEEVQIRNGRDSAFRNAGFEAKWAMLLRSHSGQVRAAAFAALKFYALIETVAKYSPDAHKDLLNRTSDITDSLFGLNDDLKNQTASEMIQTFELELQQAEKFTLNHRGWLQNLARASQQDLKSVTPLILGDLTQPENLIRYYTLIDKEIYRNYPLLKFQFKMPLIESANPSNHEHWITATVENLIAALPHALSDPRAFPASPSWIASWVGSQGSVRFPSHPQALALKIAQGLKSPPQDGALAKMVIKSGMELFQKEKNPTTHQIAQWGKDWTQADMNFWTQIRGNYARNLSKDLLSNTDAARQFMMNVAFAQLLQPVLNTAYARNKATLNQVSACMKDQTCRELSFPESQTAQTLKSAYDVAVGGLIQRFQSEATRNNGYFERLLTRFEKWNAKYGNLICLSFALPLKKSSSMSSFESANYSALREFGFFGAQMALGLAQLGLASGVAYEYFQAYQATQDWQNTAIFKTITPAQPGAMEIENIAFNRLTSVTFEVLMNLPIQIMMVQGAFQFTNASTNITRFKDLKFTEDSRRYRFYEADAQRVGPAMQQTPTGARSEEVRYDLELAHEITGLPKDLNRETFLRFKERTLTRVEKKFASNRAKNSEEAVMYEEYRAKMIKAFEIISRENRFY